MMQDPLTEFLIKVKTSNWLGEQGMVHTATLEALKKEFFEVADMYVRDDE